MSVVVILEWTYTPAGYFEEPIRVVRDHYVMTMDNGKAEARINAVVFDQRPSLREELHHALNDRFLGAQLISHHTYTLSKPTMVRLHPDGRRDIFIQLESAQIKLSAGSVDVRITDQEGNVVSDTRQERIERKKTIADLVETYRAKDFLLASLLRSHSVAVTDPDNELVHLYEIRDALAKKFGSKDAACSTLEINTGQWNRLGYIANNEPLRQGRHRGKSGAALRDATEGELIEARTIARAMVEAYLRYLDSASTK